MNSKSENYFELLKHPKWQEKRLRIMERAGFECEECGDKNTTLNVHHSFYEKGLKPWEYPDDSLHCLCEPCHLRAGEWRKAMNRQIGKLSSSQLESLLGYAYGLEMEMCETDPKVKPLGCEFIEGMLRVWLTLSHRELDRYVSEVIELIKDTDLVDGRVLWMAVDNVVRRDVEAGLMPSALVTYPPDDREYK